MKVADLFAEVTIRPNKKAFKQTDRLLGAVKKALVGIVAFKTVQWAGGMIQQVAQTADQFNKMAQQTGIASEALQQLEYAAQLSGTDLNVMRTGLQRFARNANDATRGVKTAEDGFRTLGIKVKDSSGELKSLDALLMESADAFQGMKDGPKKTATAMQVFGRAGAMMIPMLNAGSAGIDEMRKEFVELGAQIDTKTGKQFEAFNDDQLRVKTAWQGIKNQIVMGLLPTLQKLTGQMTKWLKNPANRELVKRRIQSAIEGLIFVFRVLGKTLAFVIDNWKLLATAIASVVIARKLLVIVAAFKALKIASVGAAMASLKAWLLAFAPFVILALGVAAVILIIQDLYTWFKGGDSVFKRFYESAKRWLNEAMDPVLDHLAESIADIGVALDPTGYLGKLKKAKAERQRLSQKGSYISGGAEAKAQASAARLGTSAGRSARIKAIEKQRARLGIDEDDPAFKKKRLAQMNVHEREFFELGRERAVLMQREMAYRQSRKKQREAEERFALAGGKATTMRVVSTGQVVSQTNNIVVNPPPGSNTKDIAKAVVDEELRAAEAVSGGAH
jgi:hypothetical protein